METKIFTPAELIKQIAKAGNYTTFHEIFTNESTKMYFDIEHDTIRLSAYKITQTIQEVIQNYNVRIHIGDGTKPTKMSYHVVVDVKCNFDTNRFIAKLINARVGNVCDCKVYAQNKSLRLPNCVKIDD